MLIRITSIQDEFSEVLKGLHLEALIPVLRVFLFQNVLQRICLSRRVQGSWISGYLAKEQRIDELPEALRREMIKTDLFLDAWVVRRLDGARDQLRAQLAVVASAKYMPLPVTLRAGDTVEDLREPSAASLRRVLLADRHSLGIVAGGGRGKTTLAGQIGLWLMEAEPEQRMIADWPALAVLTTGDLEDVIAAIRTGLQAGYPDDDLMAYDGAILEEALRRRRLVLIADGLSELSRPSVERRALTDPGLAREIDWGFLDRRFASVCAPGPGQPGLPTRLAAGLFILKHMHNLSDEVLCACWLENPYYQFTRLRCTPKPALPDASEFCDELEPGRWRGSRSFRQTRQAPYGVQPNRLARDIRGIGFRTADQIAAKSSAAS